MSAPAEICDTCGKTITDEDLETGSAISVLGRSYCPACKDQAVKDISLDDLGGPAPRSAKPPPKAAPAAKPAAPNPRAPEAAPTKLSPAPAAAGVEIIKLEVPKDLPPDATPRTVVAHQAARRRPVPRRGAPKGPLLVAGGAIGLAIVLTLVIVAGLRGGDDRKKGAGPGPQAEKGPTDPEKTTPPPLPPADTREAKAEEAYLKAVTISRTSESTFEQILAAIDFAAPVCKGTRFESMLEKVRAATIRDRDQTEATRSLLPLLDDLRRAVAADAAFARFAEIQGMFQKARDLANRATSIRIMEINELQQDYSRRYEEAAEPHRKDIDLTARVLADDRRYDDALKKIETFPRPLRHSGAWKSLDLLRQDIERRKRLFPSKK